MKMWKKLVACALAAMMALTLLTACGGGGSSSGGNTNVVRDKAKEEQAIGWVQEYAKENGLTLEKSEGVTEAAAAGLPNAVKALDIYRGAAEGDYAKTYQAAATAMGNSLSKQKKTGVPICLVYNEADFTKENIVQTMNSYGNQLVSQLTKAGITPKTVGAAVTVQNGMVYVTCIVAD